MAQRLYIVSSGAGGIDYITSESLRAIEDSSVVVAYSKYARELGSILEGKELCTSGMTFETKRCSEAIEFAKSGKTTCIISNGDANVYGIATIIVELIDEQNLWEEIELISLPGVTSFLATASKAGAPVSQDFAIISLSDRLTDVDLIDKRVKSSLECDFVLGIYNPKSKKRIKPYINFIEALKNHEERIVVIARHVGRVEKEKVRITTTQELIDQGLEHEDLGMSTMIIVCNSNTRLTKNGLALTPKGKPSKNQMSEILDSTS